MRAMNRIITTAAIVPNITGRSAIEAVRHDLAGDSSLSLCRYADPTEEAEDDISVERGEEIAAQDPSLLFLQADLAFYGTDEETIACCGELAVIVQSPDLTAAPAVARREKVPAGFELMQPSSLGADLAVFSAIATTAIAASLRVELDERGLP